MHTQRSPADLFRSLPVAERQKRIRKLSEAEAEALQYDWSFWARPGQRPPPGRWVSWYVEAGRGWGKTRVGAEWVRDRVRRGYGRIALVGATAADVRDVMVEGDSGLLAVHEPGARPLYMPSRRLVEWPNGARALLFSAEEPERLRGPQQDSAWCDELAAWRTTAKREGETDAEKAWSNLLFGLRIGPDPRVVITTTPRPKKWLRGLKGQRTTLVTKGTTYDNLGNLAPSFRRLVIARYEGSRLGRQELLAEDLEDVPGALWTTALIEQNRIHMRLDGDDKPTPDEVLARLPDMQTIVIGIDPAVTVTEDSSETGIIVAGRDFRGAGYVLADHSGKYTPVEWARLVVALFDGWKADRAVPEVNQGGDLVQANLRAIRPSLPIRMVRASRGKRIRAEPVSTLYEQGRVHHVGYHPELEEQMTTWDATGDEDSPDRLDAMVWALSDLLAADSGEPVAVAPVSVAAGASYGRR